MERPWTGFSFGLTFGRNYWITYIIYAMTLVDLPFIDLKQSVLLHPYPHPLKRVNMEVFVHQPDEWTILWILFVHDINSIHGNNSCFWFKKQIPLLIMKWLSYEMLLFYLLKIERCFVNALLNNCKKWTCLVVAWSISNDIADETNRIYLNYINQNFT